MKLVEALKKNDYRQALDTLYRVHEQVSDIQVRNPKVLWDRLTKEYYDNQIAEIAKPQDDPYAGLLAFGTSNTPVLTVRKIDPLYQNKQSLGNRGY